MKYPERIRCMIPEIEEAISNWPVDIQKDNVVNWILQFDNEDYDLGLRIIKNLNVIGPKDLEYSLEVAYSKLMRKAIEKGTNIKGNNTIFAGMGEDGKSGSMISYQFRLINELSEENFLSEDAQKYFESGMIQNIVLIDDVLSSGGQATKQIRNITEKFLPLGVKNIFVLTVCAFRKGIEHVEKETKAHVFSAYEYGEEDTIRSLDSSFYDLIPYESRRSVYDRLEHYGGICSRKMPLGYGGIGALLVFYYNTPNTTLPLIWASSNGWIPLFRRVKRINGIESYYKQISNKSKKEVKEKILESDELIIYTEGKVDEQIFDILISDFGLAQKLNYKKVSVVSLGGGFYSKKLFDKLNELQGRMLFVFDIYIKEIKRVSYIDDLPVVYLEPSYIQFIDLGKLIQEDTKFRNFIDRKNGNGVLIRDGNEDVISVDKDIQSFDLRDIDRYLKNRLYRANNSMAMRELLHKNFNEEGYQKFINDSIEVIRNKGLEEKKSSKE